MMMTPSSISFYPCSTLSLSINIPLFKALVEILGYAKFMKEPMTKKRNLECETIEVSHRYSIIVTNNVVEQKDYPSVFTILCTIRVCKFGKARCDLGASINLMSLDIFEELELDTPSPITMRLLMVDQSI